MKNNKNLFLISFQIVKIYLVLGLCLIFLFLLSLSSCSKNKENENENENKKEKEDLSDNGAQLIISSPVKKGPLNYSFSWRGSIRPSDQMEVRTQRQTLVTEVLVDNYQTVKKGQLILKTDKKELEKKLLEATEANSLANAELDSLKLRREQKEKDLQRKKELFQKNIIAKKVYEDIDYEYKAFLNEFEGKELQVQKTKTQLKEAEDLIKSADFVSPMNGVVYGLIAAMEGSANGGVSTGTKLFTVADPKQLDFVIRVEESNKNLLSQGKAVKIVLDAYAGTTFTGKIKEIASVSNSSESDRVKTFEVVISFKLNSKESEKIRDGQVGEAKIEIFNKNNVYCVPLVAVRYVGGESYVLLAKNEKDKPVPQKITLGVMTDKEVEVLSGINEDQFVFYSSESVNE